MDPPDAPCTLGGVSTPTDLTRRVLAAGLLLAGVLALLAAPADASGEGTVTFRPRAIPYSAAEIADVDRGQVRWQGQPPQPAGWPSPDVYYRDQVYWGRIEPVRGVYDFSPFDAGLAEAGARHGKLSFRVMAWCPGCWMESHPVGDPKPPATPSWLPRQAVDPTDPAAYRTSPPPAWNSGTFLTAWQQLMTRLGRRYDKDRRLGTIDIGGYGAYGEWHTNGFGSALTLANAKKVVAAVLRAFPHHKVLINTMIPAYVLPALRMSPRVGIRQDCLGSTGFSWTFDQYAAIRGRWRTAPVVSEWCHGGDTTIQRGAAQVSRYHVSVTSSGNAPLTYAQMSAAQRAAWRSAAKHAGYRYRVVAVTSPRAWRRGVTGPLTVRLANTGSAPTYDAWRVKVRLVRADGTIATSRRLRVDLRHLLPGTRSYTTRLRFGGLAAGRYRLAVVVTDPTAYAAPMGLATRGRSRRGDYPVGTVRVS